MVRACKIDGHHLLFRFNLVLCFAVAAVDEQHPRSSWFAGLFDIDDRLYSLCFNFQSFPG